MKPVACNFCNINRFNTVAPNKENKYADLSITNATKKKAFVIILSITLLTIILIGLVVSVKSPEETIKDQSQPDITNSLDYPKKEATQDESSIIAVGIDTMDGKELSIWLVAGSSNNFGKRDMVKGETITWTVECEQERELEIGIMFVSTEKVYSKIVKVGTGTVTFVIPESGEYRIYVKNNSLEDANFHLILDKKLVGPIV